MAESQDRDVVFSMKKSGFEASDSGNNYLLAIGIENYKDAEIPNLKNAKRDADRLVALLTQEYDFEPTHTYTLFNGEATREHIVDKLDDIAAKITPKDNFLLYFSGHGYYRKKGQSGSGYLVPSDAEIGKYSSLVTNSQLLDYLVHIEAHHILYVVDSCYSGSLISSTKNIPSFDKQREGISTYARRVNPQKSRMGLAACRIETAADGIGDHSPFTETILDVLKRNTYSLLPASELFQSVRTQTTIRADQTPVSGVLDSYKSPHEGGEFIFRRRPDEPQDWEKAKAENSVQGYEEYIRLYQKGTHKEEAYWSIAQLKNAKSGFRAYLEAYQGGKYYREALEGMARCEEKEKYEQAKRRGESALRMFLLDYREGEYAGKAREEIKRLLAKETEAAKSETEADQKRREEEKWEKELAEKPEPKRQEEIAAKKAEEVARTKKNIQKASPDKEITIKPITDLRLQKEESKTPVLFTWLTILGGFFLSLAAGVAISLHLISFVYGLDIYSSGQLPMLVYAALFVSIVMLFYWKGIPIKSSSGKSDWYAWIMIALLTVSEVSFFWINAAGLDPAFLFTPISSFLGAGVFGYLWSKSYTLENKGKRFFIYLGISLVAFIGVRFSIVI